MRVIMIIAMSFFGLLSPAHAQYQYHSDKLKFSFVLPEGWERTPKEKLSEYYRSLLYGVRPDPIEMEVFSLSFADALQTPYIYLESSIDTTESEKELEEHYLSYNGREHEYFDSKFKQWGIDRLRKGSGSAPKTWKGARRIGTDFYYDQERHAAVETVELYHERVGKILCVDVRFLGSRRRTSFNCYWDGENPDEFLDLLDGIVDSFSYDEGYGFGETAGLITAFKKKAWRNWTSGGLLGIIGFAFIVYILQRWADR